MKTKLSILLLTIISTINTTTFASDVWLGSFSDSDGKQLKWWVPEDVLLKTPPWNGIFSNTPFNLDDFIIKGRKYIQEKHNNSNNLPFTSVLVKKTNNTMNEEAREQWVIIIQYAGDALFASYSRVYFLTDGTIVEPTPSANK